MNFVIIRECIAYPELLLFFLMRST